MTNNTDATNKPKLTLKLDPNKISPKLEGVIKRNIPGATTSKNVTVEVRKNRTRSLEDKKDIYGKQGGSKDLTQSELAARMTALKNAANVNEDNLLSKKSKLSVFENTQEDIEQEVIKLEKIANEESAQEPIEIRSAAESVASHQVAKSLEVKHDKTLSKTPAAKTAEEFNDEEENNKKKLLADKTKKIVKEEPVVPSKNKYEERRNSNRIDVRTITEDDEQKVKTRSLSSIKRAREKAKRQEIGMKPQEKIVREVIVPEIITVQELASRMAEKSSDVLKELMKLGMLVTINQPIDADTAELIIETFGHKIKRVTEADVENILLDVADNPEALKPRPPVVTIMGHVDHGKTSLLDALKATDVASKEAGGITQHIGAYQVKVNEDHFITFLDTPGHEAFTAMRSRGAQVTDIVVLVVAADDGIMAQTVEAINHAKAADVPIIVAINKIDKPEANIERIKSELLNHDLVPEEFGGDIVSVPVSAKQRLNLDKLIDAILLQAEMLNLTSNPDRSANGAIIESKIDKGKGVVATLLVQKGSLKIGDIIVAGSTSGKVRAMHNDKGKNVTIASPSMPVEVIGLESAPVAGDSFAVVQTDKQARDIGSYRERKMRETKSSQLNRMNNLEAIFARSAAQGKVKELPIIIKGDVHGSIEAIAASLNKIINQEVRVRILHSAVGAITESDVSLAQASNAIILGFNVRASNVAKQMADRDKIDIRYYSIIYNLIDDIKLALSGMLAPIIREEYIGNAEIRQVFNITKFGKIAGCYITNGMIKRGAGVRLLRDNIVIHEGKLKTLRRFKDDVKEVKEGFECGVAFENYEDIREKDMLEAFELIEEKQKL
ncbi:translation initiation factor IF-2 [Rickettsiales endosymbiont of Stachyamoeba lipophora]|uniref:translation initiation factor IF-2 n=1 Tax=Rickettsiales endosymbiont of Stachyamoeba lipophora TaxID=2486578 RepID=UPI000F64B0AC|nr:translation initiation factor IF-2 [Rickettsiales endosymbiont of Stachyamoeba lipophora]AZL15960.1 translation initiation factor IF-2 [Rickettsiales endosymbiont of Stachyamoeba lipophora]